MPSQGGGFYFLELFRNYLEENGIPWTDDWEDDFDILFANSWHVPYENILAAKRRRPSLRVIHRVDGSARNYGRYDDSDCRQARVNLVADATVFQSEYCRYSTREKFKVIRHDGPIIHNAVDLQTFSPIGERDSSKEIKICNASWSTNPRKGTWQIGELARRNPSATFVLCGRYIEVPNQSNVCYLGHLGYVELARTMRSCDAFLDLSENECCPNVVLQALASGLPVLHKRSGALPEITGSAGIPLDDDLGNFSAALRSVTEMLEPLKARARHRAETEFAPDLIFPRYLELIENCSRLPLPTQGLVLRAAIQGYPVLPTSAWPYRVRRITQSLFRYIFR
jgi:glycosyltransferase involved in cell wall biosynthesis